MPGGLGVAYLNYFETIKLGLVDLGYLGSLFCPLKKGNRMQV